MFHLNILYPSCSFLQQYMSCYNRLNLHYFKNSEQIFDILQTNTMPIVLNKPQGMTPLEAIHQLRTTKPELKNQVMGYAGRLDPMAEGVLVILVGDENKNRTHYERLPKKYEFELLLGISTDSYDGLGLVTQANSLPANWEKQLRKIVQELPHSFEQPYPPYSAARVNGKPLFYWAREGKIHEVTIPTKTVTIDQITILETHLTTIDEILPPLLTRIHMVQGSFRQEEIEKQWINVQKEHHNLQVALIRMEVTCSSGLYIRSLCDDIGHKMTTGGIAYSITRTAVAEMTRDSAECIYINK